MRRVAVTGIGVISPLGNDPLVFFNNPVQGHSGIGRLSVRVPERLTNRVGAAVSFDPSQHFANPQIRMLDRVSQFALAAAAQAVQDAGITFDENTMLAF